MNDQITVTSLQSQYPNPSTGDDPITSRYGEEHSPLVYCVGGALCRTVLGHDKETDEAWAGIDFPIRRTLADVLRQVNPNLTEFKSIDFARTIIDANDEGNFDEAWAWMDKALTQGP